MIDDNRCTATEIAIREGATALRGLFLALDELDPRSDSEAVTGIILAGRPFAIKHADDVDAYFDQLDGEPDATSRLTATVSKPDKA